MSSVQQAHGVNQLSNKEKAAIDEAVKEAAINSKNAKASQDQLVVVTGVIKNLQSRGLFLNKHFSMRGHFLANPSETIMHGKTGTFVQAGNVEQVPMPIIVGAKAAVIYSPLDKAAPSLGWLLAWHKYSGFSDEINKVYVEAGDLGRLLNMTESEIEQKLDASHDVSRYWDSATGAAAAARIESNKGDKFALVGAAFDRFDDGVPRQS